MGFNSGFKGLIYIIKIFPVFSIFPPMFEARFFVAFWLMNVLVSGVKFHCILYFFSVDRGPFCRGRVCYMASILWSSELCLFSWVTRYWRNGSCAFCLVFNVLVRYFRMFLCMVFRATQKTYWIPYTKTYENNLTTRCVLSGRGLWDELITRPEESYRVCCVVVCDLETSRIGAPYIYIYIYIYIYKTLET